MASGWNLWMWLESIGLGWLVGVAIRRYIDILIIIITFPYSTCISSFLAAASLLLCSFLNVFRSYSKELCIREEKKCGQYRDRDISHQF